MPEVASRHHLELVNAVVDDALREAGIGLRDAGLVAATSRPGLIGALLVGLSTAKALAASARLPFVAVDHLHGHVAANFLEPEPLEPPFLCLIASGGHTLLASVERPDGFELLGATRDDAAGEALDKAARMMGLGYPGAPRSTGSRAKATPAPSTSRSGCGAATPWTSASAASRPRSSTRSGSWELRARLPGAQTSRRRSSSPWWSR